MSINITMSGSHSAEWLRLHSDSSSDLCDKMQSDIESIEY